MSPLRAVSTPTLSKTSSADMPMHSPSPLRQGFYWTSPGFLESRSQLESAAPLTTPTSSSFPPRRPLTRLCSDTTFAQPLVPLSDSDSDGSDLELDIDADSVIRDFGISYDAEIRDVDPNDGQDISILKGADDEGELS
ncbi:hypothetical protein FRC09_001399 [Ceratobasidium sp. 395]|nr:hypothetical protein FRC09_001399 [Ceratobasidium sp. 395]